MAPKNLSRSLALKLGLGWLRVQDVLADTCFPPTLQVAVKPCTFSVAGQPDVESWGVYISVGNSTAGSPTMLCAAVSTVVNSTLLPSREICSENWRNGSTPQQCRSRRGGYVIETDLPNVPITGLSDKNPGWVSLMASDTKQPFQYAVNTAVQFRDKSVTMIDGLISEGQQSTNGHIGLAEDSTLLQAAKDAGLIGAKSFGLNSGSQSYAFPRDGSLVLGGYDEASMDGPPINYKVAKTFLNRRPCPLQISITQMNFTVQSNGSLPKLVSLNDATQPLTVCVEPYDNLFRLGPKNLQTIQDTIAGVLPKSTSSVSPADYKPLYNLEPGLVYRASDGALNASLHITLGTGRTVVIPSHELVRPLRGLDESGTQVYNTEFNEVQVYGQAAPEDGPVMGKAFLSQLYLFVDYESMTFSLSKQNMGASTPLARSSASCSDSGGLTKSDKGLIAVGSVLGVFLLGLAVYVAIKVLPKVDVLGRNARRPSTPSTL